MKKKKWIWVIPLAVAAVGIGWFFLTRTVSESPKITDHRTPTDQSLLDSVLQSPEAFEKSLSSPVPEEESAAPSTEISIFPPASAKRFVEPLIRPQLLSEVKKPMRVNVVREPVAAESLYFWKDYASLRTEAVRDPDSEENRAGVVSLLQARQRRAGEKK